MHEAAAPLLAGGILWKIQLDTYEREVERYGGAEGVALAERIFQADSETVLEILEMLEEGDAGVDERWRLALRGIDMLLGISDSIWSAAPLTKTHSSWRLRWIAA